MNIVIVPFHDWRKIQLEGFRTRDAHFIEKLSHNCNITVIINRPATLLELRLKKKTKSIDGELIFSRNGFRLYNLYNQVYLIDYISADIPGQIRIGYAWFIRKYGNPAFISFINEALDRLGLGGNNYNLLTQNVFAHKLADALSPKKAVFDAWDNFAKFGVYKKIKSKIIEGYHSLATSSDFWLTNSRDNIAIFEDSYKPRELHLIPNGIDISRFMSSEVPAVPLDLQTIKRPIIGFGGKITHLIDVELLNRTMALCQDVSFVFVGQILDRRIFKRIHKGPNFYYLGDKHYDLYPSYVRNFDVCIVPYVVDDKQKSGANTIKVYEYLGSGKKVVGTGSNGLEDLGDHVYIVSDAEEFANELRSVENNKAGLAVEEHSWFKKAEDLLKLLKK